MKKACCTVALFLTFIFGACADEDLNAHKNLLSTDEPLPQSPATCANANILAHRGWSVLSCYSAAEYNDPTTLGIPLNQLKSDDVLRILVKLPSGQTILSAPTTPGPLYDDIVSWNTVLTLPPAETFLNFLKKDLSGINLYFYITLSKLNGFLSFNYSFTTYNKERVCYAPGHEYDNSFLCYEKDTHTFEPVLPKSLIMVIKQFPKTKATKTEQQPAPLPTRLPIAEF